MSEPSAVFADGRVYERLMGRWSRRVGRMFLDWLALPKGLRCIDVGCGNGAFTEELIAHSAPAGVVGIDPSDGQLAHARSRAEAGLAQFQTGDAQALPFADRSFDAALMALVISFVPDPAKAVREMARVTRPGGLVATYMWDAAAGGIPVEPIHAAMRSLGFDAPHPPGLAVSRQDGMQALWQQAGLQSIETRAIRIEVSFSGFGDFWESNDVPVGPAGQAIQRLSPEMRDKLKAKLREQLPAGPDGRIVYESFANAVKGRVSH
jgi:SAM-dependent methyltransferase